MPFAWTWAPNAEGAVIVGPRWRELDTLSGEYAVSVILAD
jgi:hypothetical protein